MEINGILHVARFLHTDMEICIKYAFPHLQNFEEFNEWPI
jgi:hypothetical protein